MAAENTTPATDLADGWIRTAPGQWANSGGWTIAATIGYRCAATFSIARPDGVAFPDGERSLTAAKTAVAIQEAVALGLL